MGSIRYVAVIDIGKTNAKVALVDLDTLAETGVRRTANRPLAGGPYRHHDTETLWSFILESLAALGTVQKIDAISVTTHGATAALLAADGDLVLPILDYEDDGLEALRGEYETVRPAFAETGSPALAGGLNLGAQIYWQSCAFPQAFDRTAMILAYPQYWSWRLTGIAASEVTSLGCHTDLWNPHAEGFSTLVAAMGWQKLFPPLRPASACLGVLRADIAARTGLDPSTPVCNGIHDSNASLLPHLLARRTPFSVVSTGTWVVSMAVGGRKLALDPARDTLVNVNALGDPVNSARFMGGREFEMLGAEAITPGDEEAMRAVIEGRIMLLPSVQQGSGPFPRSNSRWIGDPSPAGRTVAIAFYLALMTATCLDLIGADGDISVEGPFAANRLYCDMLQAATGRPVLAQSGQSTGTAIGAALLADMKRMPSAARVDVYEVPEGWRRYAQDWRAAANAIACGGHPVC